MNNQNESIIADCIYQALVMASSCRSLIVERPTRDGLSLIDGELDFLAVARCLNDALHDKGFEIRSLGNEE